MPDSEKIEYENRLRRRLNILKSEIEAGRVHFAPGLNVIEKLKAVRYGSDGEIDLDTVDSSIRALALATEVVHDRKELKEAIPLRELQAAYFKNIDSIFGRLYQDMERKGLSPFQIGVGVSKDPEGVQAFYPIISNFMSWLRDLWKEAHDVVHIHAEDTFSLKSVFGGETFPQGDNIVSCTGIYVDTTILPDPFLRNFLYLEKGSQEDAVRSFVTSGLSLLQYKQAILAESEVPLALVVPDLFYLDNTARQQVMGLANNDAVEHLNALFGTHFSDIEEAQDFVRALDTPAEVAKHLANPSLLVFDVDEDKSAEENISRYIRMFHEPFGQDLHAGRAVISTIAGRMRQANDLLFRSTRLGGSPLIQAPTSWRYFNWKLGYGKSQYNQTNHLHLHITKALESAAHGDMQWLGAVPIDALIEMRKQGALDELREILSAGIKDLIELRPDNFYRTSDRVLENIQKAFESHQQTLSQLTGKKWRFAGVDLASCVVKGAVQVASACGVPVVSLVGAALDQALDVPKAKDIPKRFRELREETRRINGSAVGMLFQISKKARRAD